MIAGICILQGKLVYANYGRDEDFDALTRIGVNVSGKIVIMRYGKVGRATKVCIDMTRGRLQSKASRRLHFQ